MGIDLKIDQVQVIHRRSVGDPSAKQQPTINRQTVVVKYRSRHGRLLTNSRPILDCLSTDVTTDKLTKVSAVMSAKQGPYDPTTATSMKTLPQNSFRILKRREFVLQLKKGFGAQGAKNVSFAACHSGKLQLACTSPKVILTSPMVSKVDNTSFVIRIP